MNEEALLDQILQTVLTLVESGVQLDDQTIQAVSEILSDAIRAELQSTEGTGQEPEEPPEEIEPPENIPNAPPITDPVTLLWILAGGDESAFVNYLRTYPDPQLNALLRNPSRLTQTIERLRQRNITPDRTQESAQGIPHGPLNSSNIYGFRYDPKSGRLLVRFNSGSVYGYSGVPEGVFRVFAQGAVPAKTSGQNEYGRWWVGKQPSAGAAFYEMIRQGGFPYERLS